MPRIDPETTKRPNPTQWRARVLHPSDAAFPIAKAAFHSFIRHHCRKSSLIYYVTEHGQPLAASALIDELYAIVTRFDGRIIDWARRDWPDNRNIHRPIIPLDYCFATGRVSGFLDYIRASRVCIDSIPRASSWNYYYDVTSDELVLPYLQSSLWRAFRPSIPRTG